jgi:hypothetical protein
MTGIGAQRKKMCALPAFRCCPISGRLTAKSLSGSVDEKESVVPDFCRSADAFAHERALPMKKPLWRRSGQRSP